MTEYYETIDVAEAKRIHDQAKLRLQEIKEHGGQALQDFVNHFDLGAVPKEIDEAWDKKALAASEKLLKDEYDKKRKTRMPFVIIPSTPISLGIEDKEGNQVYSLTCFKAQSEDVIKALRRKGYTSRTFSYNKEAWE